MTSSQTSCSALKVGWFFEGRKYNTNEITGSTTLGELRQIIGNKSNIKYRLFHVSKNGRELVEFNTSLSAHGFKPDTMNRVQVYVSNNGGGTNMKNMNSSKNKVKY